MSGSEEESSSSGEGDGATNPETNESLLENSASAPDGGVGASGEVGAVSSGGLSRLADRIALALTKKLGGGRSTSARKSAGSDKSSSAGETAPGLLSAPDELYDVRDPDRAHNAPIVDRDGAPPLFHKTKSKISLAEPLSAGVVSPARDSAASSDRKTGKKVHFRIISLTLFRSCTLPAIPITAQPIHGWTGKNVGVDSTKFNPISSRFGAQTPRRSRAHNTANTQDDWGTFRPVRMTRELAQELQVIRARGFLDPTKYFKNPGKRRRYNTDVQVLRLFFLVQLISAAVTTPCNHTKRSLSTQSYSYCLSPTTSLRAHRPRFAASLFHSIGDSGAYPARPDLRLVVYLTMRRTGMWTVRRRKRQIDQISTLYCMSMLHPLFLSSQKASDDHT